EMKEPMDAIAQKATWNYDDPMQVIDINDMSVYYQQQPQDCLKTTSSSEERFVLKNVNLRINPGERVGVCGRSGTGKSSLVNALLRFNSHTGQIRFGGNLIESYQLTDLRRHISIIPQYPVIFSGSIRENLDLFDQFSDADLWAVLDK